MFNNVLYMKGGWDKTPPSYQRDMPYMPMIYWYTFVWEGSLLEPNYRFFFSDTIIVIRTIYDAVLCHVMPLFHTLSHNVSLCQTEVSYSWFFAVDYWGLVCLTVEVDYSAWRMPPGWISSQLPGSPTRSPASSVGSPGERSSRPRLALTPMALSSSSPQQRHITWMVWKPRMRKKRTWRSHHVSPIWW